MNHYKEIDIEEILDFKDFSFADWYNGEKNILTPQLQKLGYSNIRWSMGEQDSFGPLSRVVTMTDSSGQVFTGWYG